MITRTVPVTLRTVPVTLVTWQLEHYEEFDHEWLLKIEQFSKLLNYL